MVIWKWDLDVAGRQVIHMPFGAKILVVQAQGESASLWALCDPEAVAVTRYIGIYGTGNPIPNGGRCYISTFQTASGNLVFHVFEETA
jgi:hypothetical protein